MALRVRSITPGRMVKGRFIPNPKGKMKLGKGGRFKKLEAEIAARGGALDPHAVAASIGLKKYGKQRMLGWARKAKKAKSNKRKNRRRN